MNVEFSGLRLGADVEPRGRPIEARGAQRGGKGRIQKVQRGDVGGCARSPRAEEERGGEERGGAGRDSQGMLRNFWVFLLRTEFSHLTLVLVAYPTR